MMSNQVTLQQCPAVLFNWNGYIGLKTCYGLEYPDGSGKWWPEAYLTEGGAIFWGNAKTHEERCNILVQPIKISELV